VPDFPGTYPLAPTPLPLHRPTALPPYLAVPAELTPFCVTTLASDMDIHVIGQLASYPSLAQQQQQQQPQLSMHASSFLLDNPPPRYRYNKHNPSPEVPVQQTQPQPRGKSSSLGPVYHADADHDATHPLIHRS